MNIFGRKNNPNPSIQHSPAPSGSGQTCEATTLGQSCGNQASLLYAPSCPNCGPGKTIAMCRGCAGYATRSGVGCANCAPGQRQQVQFGAPVVI